MELKFILTGAVSDEERADRIAGEHELFDGARSVDRVPPTVSHNQIAIYCVELSRRIYIYKARVLLPVPVITRCMLIEDAHAVH